MATETATEDLYELARDLLFHLNEKAEAAPFLAAYDMRIQFNVRDGSPFYAVLKDGKVQNVDPGQVPSFSNRDDLELFGQEVGFRLVFEKRTTPATATETRIAARATAARSNAVISVAAASAGNVLRAASAAAVTGAANGAKISKAAPIIEATASSGNSGRAASAAPISARHGKHRPRRSLERRVPRRRETLRPKARSIGAAAGAVGATADATAVPSSSLQAASSSGRWRVRPPLRPLPHPRRKP